MTLLKMHKVVIIINTKKYKNISTQCSTHDEDITRTILTDKWETTQTNSWTLMEPFPIFSSSISEQDDLIILFNLWWVTQVYESRDQRKREIAYKCKVE